jgi:NAD(P)-dependent dehydrogenase (short-subunit alcohol dehydrogenase family)
VAADESSLRRLEGKVAVVTGGARGIGREVAAALAQAGAAVTIADLGAALDGSGTDASVAEAAAAEIRRDGGRCRAMAADVGDPQQAAAIVAETVEAFGKLDILVNVAGNIRPGSIADVDPADWDATLRVHVTGSLNTTRAAFRHWTERAGHGRRLLNVSSDAGLFGDAAYLAYGVAKAGVVALTLGCAGPLRALGGTANVFIPQAATRMTASIPAEGLPDADRWATGEFDAAHVPPALVYLASDDAAWISGQIVGGWGYEVHLYTQARRARSLHSTGPWSLDELFRRFRPAFEPYL